jgi:hypothetical protein
MKQKYLLFPSGFYVRADLCRAMTFIEKYKILQDRNYLVNMISRSVYDTMHLEGQGLPLDKIKKLVEHSLPKPPAGSEGDQLLPD